MEFENIDRRTFIFKAAAGIISAALGVMTVRDASGGKDTSSGILYRTLGRTGLRIPLVSFGVMNSDNPDLIKKAIDLGINHLDTAHLYLRGNSERTIGKILQERKCRNRIYVGTKLFFARDSQKKVFSSKDIGRYPAATEDNFNEQIDTSLDRLCTDYVDILYLHNCEGPLMPSYEPMMAAFVRAKASGKARFIGISTHAHEPETIRAAVDAGIWDVVLTSYNFLQENKEEVRKAIHYAAKQGLGVIAMKTQGGVFLNREKQIEVNHAAALRWVLNDEHVCTAIPGMTTFDQMNLDFGVMSSLPLSQQEKRDLKISSMLMGPLFCRQCFSCTSTCPRAVDIPALMRAYMYAEGYGNGVQAAMTLDEIDPEHGLAACRVCSKCKAFCRFGINIRNRLDSLMALPA